MTRKRFIKLLMAWGAPRNTVVRIASAMVNVWGSYEAAWSALMLLDAFCRNLCDALYRAADYVNAVRAFIVPRKQAECPYNES